MTRARCPRCNGDLTIPWQEGGGHDQHCPEEDSTGRRVLPMDAPRADWLAARRTGIGASEIAAVAGIARGRGPWDVWSAKVDGIETASSDEMRWGQFIESRIIEWWAQETGRTVGHGGLFRHPAHHWLLATPDALELSDVGKAGSPFEDGHAIAVIDAKNAGWYLGGDWDDDGAPVEYVCQITWQMLAVGVDRGVLVAAVGGRPPVTREFTLDDQLAGELLERGAAFWRMVVDRTPPPLDGSDSARRWVTARYADADADLAVDLDDADLGGLAQIIGLEERIKALQSAKQAMLTALKDRLGLAVVGRYKGDDYVTWKTIKRAGYTVEPTTYRDLTIKSAARKALANG